MPKILDLFCGAGGAAMGYHRAGFDVVGVDIRPQPNYPFEFERGDALQVLRLLIDGLYGETFDAIHASPPCQDYSRSMRHRQTTPRARLIDSVRDHLVAYGLPWVIENVVGAPLPRQDTLDGRYGIELCGTMFDRRFWRHRLFETSFPVHLQRGCNHNGPPPINPYNTKSRIRDGLQTGSMKAYSAAMGTTWMRDKEASEAIPPAYTQFIGTQLMAHLERVAA